MTFADHISIAPERPRRRSLRSSWLIAGTMIVFLSTASWLRAHDFWLVPDAFQVTPGGTMDVRGQTGTAFPASDSPVALERIADARLVGAAGSESLTELSQVGKSLMIHAKPTTPGERIVVVSLKPATARETPDAFRRYLKLEGAAEAAGRLDREGRIGTDTLTRRTTKHAKTFVEVGRGGPRAFGLASGQPVELIPGSDPFTLRAGDTLVVRLIARGQPIGGATLRAGAAPGGITRESSGKEVTTARAGETDAVLITDAGGAARVPITHAGLWNVRAVHVVPGEAGSGVAWDVHWLTMVFQVANGEVAFSSAPRADSAAVVEAINRFHAALASGDSTVALAVLADDALIIEGGDVQTREQYPSHHLGADIAFAKAVPSTRTVVRVIVRGDAAWVTSTSVTEGTYNGRALNSVGAELAVMSRESGSWKIRAIHWSSHARRPAP